MGSIVTRKRKDGSASFSAQILMKKDGVIIHRESKNFTTQALAKSWMAKREKELAKPGEIERQKASKITFGMAIKKYMEESEEPFTGTRKQVLNAVMRHAIASLNCENVTSQKLVEYAKELKQTRSAATVGNYISHLSVPFDIAKPAWGYSLDSRAYDDALAVMKQLKLIDKSLKRDKRPTLAELDKLLDHFAHQERRLRASMQMRKIIAFAIFSTRRLSEITSIQWADFEPEHNRILVRDMKHPDEKAGNNVWCELTPEAIAIIESMPKKKARIFPYNKKSVGLSFTNACKILDIENLHFHDLRHEGISRLFEMGKPIPIVATHSGHRTWSSLQRYTHIRQTGDKYKDWKWLPIVTAKA